MAKVLSIEGNFLVIYDDVENQDLLRKIRNNIEFTQKREGNIDEGYVNYYYFFQKDSVSTNPIQETFKYSFNELIDGRTGIAFTSVSNLSEFLSLNLGGVNAPIFSQKSTFSDYAKIATGTLPTEWTKLDYSGAILVYETADLFDAPNSRIEGMNLNQSGIASISLIVDTSGAANDWLELQLRGFDVTNTELFAKRGKTVSLVKNVLSDSVNENLEFYFGEDVAYFEVWFRASSALDYSNQAITVIKF